MNKYVNLLDTSLLHQKNPKKTDNVSFFKNVFQNVDLEPQKKTILTKKNSKKLLKRNNMTLNPLPMNPSSKTKLKRNKRDDILQYLTGRNVQSPNRKPSRANLSLNSSLIMEKKGETPYAKHYGCFHMSENFFVKTKIFRPGNTNASLREDGVGNPYSIRKLPLTNCKKKQALMRANSPLGNLGSIGASRDLKTSFGSSANFYQRKLAQNFPKTNEIRGILDVHLKSLNGNPKQK